MNFRSEGAAKMRSLGTLTISSRIWILSAYLLLNLLAVGGVSYWGASKLGNAMDEQLSLHFPAVTKMTLADMMHDGIRANALTAIVNSGSANAQEVEEIRKESEEFRQNLINYLADLNKLDFPDPLREALRECQSDVEIYESTAAKIVQLALGGKLEEAMRALPELKEKFEILERKFEKIGDMIRENAAAGGKLAAEERQLAVRVNLLAMLVGVLFGLVLAFWVNRGLQRSLRTVMDTLGEESKQVGDTSRALSSSADSLSQSSSRQASALQETASSMDEISAMVQKTSEGASRLESLAGANQASASKGQSAIREMLDAIAAMDEGSARMMTEVETGNQKITEIVKVIGEIGNKTKVINDIVFQTKLLSFNASVEAARAGEHGKGFAVVAEEVGKLAVMSGSSAKEISDLLSTSLARVEAIVNENRSRVQTMLDDSKARANTGSKVAQQCQGALEEIVQCSGDVNSMISEMTVAIREQTQGVQEVAKAISMLDRTTQENTATASSTNETSRNLLERAGSLEKVVFNLQLLVVGAAEVPEASQRALSVLPAVDSGHDAAAA